MLTKEQVINSLKNLPEKFSVDEIINQIILLAKIDQGLEQSNNNQIISEEDLNKRLSKWLD
ncbi:MAG: hypothetical protein WC599_06880 [Bacteroidales bacterium]